MKKILILPLIVSLFFLYAGAVEAHVIEIDGTIHGVMHITPAHKPTADEPTHFEFFMMNTKTKFDSKAYGYSLQITGNGMASATAPVHADGSTLRADYIFPKEGENYTATLTGSSTVSSQPNFVLDFDGIFVYPPGKHENPIENLLSDHVAHVILVILIILAFGGIVAWDKFVIQRRAVQVPPSKNP